MVIYNINYSRYDYVFNFKFIQRNALYVSSYPISTYTFLLKISLIILESKFSKRKNFLINYLYLINYANKFSFYILFIANLYILIYYVRSDEKSILVS